MKTNNHDDIRRGKGILLIIFGLIALAAHIGSLKFEYMWGNVTQNDLVVITDITTEKPKINSGKNANLLIRLKNHNDIRFENSNIFYSATRAKDFLKDYKIRDSLSLLVWDYDYTTKITKVESRNFFERFASPDDLVDFYGLIYKGKEYVDLKKINSAFYWKSPLKYFNWVICFGIIAYGVYLIRRKVIPRYP